MTGYFHVLFLLLLSYLKGTTNAFCPRDGVSGSSEGTCFFAISSMGSTTFETGQSFCAEFYGNMAAVTNAFDNRIILDLAQRTFPNAISIWLGAKFDGHAVVWTDGSPDSYRNFQQATPEAGNVCMDLATGRWLTTKAEASTMPFVCGMNDTSTTTAPTHPSCAPVSPCPDKYFYSSTLRNCYRGLYYINHDPAEAECQKDGAHLASIHSLAENTLLNQMFQSGEATCDQAFFPFIGGHRTGLGKTDWEWIDGTPFNYTNWADNQPDNYHENEYCNVIFAGLDDCHGNKGQWNDVSCAWLLRGAICKVPAKY